MLEHDKNYQTERKEIVMLDYDFYRDVSPGRRSKVPLTDEDVAEIVGGPVLYVYLKKDAEFPGRGDLNSCQPTDSDIIDRIRQAWPIDDALRIWLERPNTAPKAIIGVSGQPRPHVCIGAIDLSGTGWERAVVDDDARVCLEHPLDAFQLRGRILCDTKFDRNDDYSWRYRDQFGHRVCDIGNV